MIKIKKEKRKKATIHYYIDESGSPEFFGKRKKILINKDGYSPLLIIGLISIINRKHLCSEIENFKNGLLNDKSLQHIYSLHQPGWYLHAKDDHPEVRKRFFEFLSKKSFRGYFIIGRKKLKVFLDRHNGSEKEFYFDLVQNLLKDRFTDFSEYKIYLSRRSGSSINTFSDAIDASIEKYNKSTKKEDIEPIYSCNIVASKVTPELSVVDYLLWALQRYISTGDKTYFEMLQNKFCFIYDIYAKKKIGQTRYYNHETPFDLDRAEKFL